MKNVVIGVLAVAVAVLGVVVFRDFASKAPSPSSAGAAVTTGTTDSAPTSNAASSSANVMAPPPAGALALCRTLLEATIRGDYAAFKRECESRGDANMRSVASNPETEMTFRKAARVLAKPCWGGYDLQYLGALSQSGGHRIFLWKLTPSSGRDEFLIRLTLRDHQLAGFFFQ